MTSKQQQRLYNHLGENIKKFRSQKGLTQEQLAHEIALTRTSIVNMEQGRQHPPLHVIFDIVKVLEVSLDSLLPNEKDYHSDPILDEHSLKDVSAKDVSRIESFLEDFKKTTHRHE